MSNTQTQIKNIFLSVGLEWKGYNLIHSFESSGRVFTIASFVEAKYDRDTGQQSEVGVIKIWTKVIYDILVLEVFLFKEKEIKLHIPAHLLGFLNDILNALQIKKARRFFYALFLSIFFFSFFHRNRF